MNRYRMFLVQILHNQLQACTENLPNMQNNQLPTKTPVQLKDNFDVCSKCTKPLASFASQSLYLVQFLIICITKNMNMKSLIIFAS